MKKNKIKLSDMVENPEHYFVMLKPASKTRKDIYNLNINVSGYSDLFTMIMDLLKAGMLALEGIEISENNHKQTERYIYSLLKVIEMMIPLEEGDLLDMLHSRYLKEKKKISAD
ncbi:hypothetical protein IRZ71_20465 [Flavobacterium sp. ANB]|uniref:hypothetical protein n=1 Tax=unclassified Flavobacterium TaxID=196869 RepID=UPI0012B74976|nr:MULTISPECIES: hypothetical protein [unclassified Flavobacterium]MBF4518736.1 hypothetical protein [Flavobacterium sp. ANB]MTD67733.1 hypothetical protein [Flavobacterium sp. LC2016-13]